MMAFKSDNPKKKLDIYYKGVFIKSIGDSKYKDYKQYLKIDKDLAKKRRIAYFNRHRKGIEAGKLGEVLAWLFLWN
jgi:hypothetical protein